MIERDYCINNGSDKDTSTNNKQQWLSQLLPILMRIGQGQKQRKRKQTPALAKCHSMTQMLLLLTIFFVIISTQIQCTYGQQQTCDYLSDTSCNWKYDKECDAASLPQCAGGDCFDCDVCLSYSYDCELCTSNNCYWCPGDAVCASQPIGANIWALDPDREPACRLESDWVTACTVPADTTNIFTDPLYDSMKWIYELINVEPVWQEGITGAGIHVRINDDGVDATHDEFKENFDFEHSCDLYLPNDFQVDVHGTACANIIAGNKNNNACAVGIAPDATISACNGPETLETAAEIFMVHLDVVDIISNSWGPLPCENYLIEERQQQENTDLDKLKQIPCPFLSDHETSPCNVCGSTFYDVLSPDCKEAITDYCSTRYELDPIACGEYLDLYVSCEFHSLSAVNEEGWAKVVQEGRGGKGAIITFAGGNDYRIGVDANSDGMVNSRYTVGIGAVGKNGKHASYSTTGAAIMVSAPGGDEESISNNIVAKPGTVNGCHDVSVGTSFSTPVVSGVAALVLQANPELGWRDFQGILAATSQKVDFEDESWTTNAAGYSHSYKYGFGLIDARAAVAAARIWQNWDQEKQILKQSGEIEILIPDFGGSPADVFAKLTITDSDVQSAAGTDGMHMESVVVYLSLQHASRGDLEIVLTSPQGTKSILAPSKRPETTVLQDDETWKLMSLRSWGENPVGSWQLDIIDLRGQDEASVQQMLRAWSIIVYGHASTSSNSQTLATPPPDSQTETLAPTVDSVDESQVDTSPPVSATCNYQDETCPFPYLFDKECDSSSLESCANADCFDCDPCQVYSYDCASCVQNGCLFCPGDAVCLSVGLDTQYWSIYGKTSACATANDWTRTCEPSATNVFQDPLYDSMAWLYELINVESVWREGITGAGVHVRVNDDGVDATHPEFASNFDEANSCADYLPSSETGSHGTACASIIAASNNSDCAVGVAPGATISACKFPDDDDELEAQMFLTNLEAVDISSNSYGPDTCFYTEGRKLQQQCPFNSENSLSPCSLCGDFAGDLTEECLSSVARYCSTYYEVDQNSCIEFMDFFVGCYYHILPDVMQQSWTRTIVEGRNGKGIIYLVSAGNSYSSRENSNANGYLNSRFTMAISAVGKDGLHASYSTEGASVFISAPGGDIESVSNNLVAKPGGGCHDIGMGTSFSTPVVSGIVALMLEVNPNLTWRDVQGVLASTARFVDSADDSWTTNSAGFRHSNKYGFGLADAAAAVAASRTWRLWGSEMEIPVDSGALNVEIPDQQGVTSTMTIQDPRNLTIESVVVYLDMTHQSRGDLEIKLRTPGGTESILAHGNRPLNQQLPQEGRWKFLTYAAWGESPPGDWTITISDMSPGTLSPCADFLWGVILDGGREVSCQSFQDGLDCADPSVGTTAYDGRTAAEACCACGGGTDVSSVSNTFKSWSMNIYSHDENAVVTYPPTASPAIPGGGNSTESGSATDAPVPSNSSTDQPLPSSTFRPIPEGPLSEAVIMTISPNVTNAPFITSGASFYSKRLPSLGVRLAALISLVVPILT